MRKILLCLCLLASMACARKIVANGEPGSAYHSLLRSLTVERKNYTLDRVLYKTSIAYKSCDLRKAYVEEYADAYKLGADEITKMMAEEMADCEKYDAFVVAHFATDRETNRIDTKTGVWKMSLSTEVLGNQVIGPESVVALPGEKPVLMYFYPFITPWSRTYLMKFPKQAPSKNITLYMDGVEDNVKFVWKP